MSKDIDLTYASSIENIDFAIYDWLDRELNLFCSSKDGLKKTPVLWVTPERAYQVKTNKEFRDVSGAISLPLITVERTSIIKDQKNNGVYNANIPPKDNRHIISKRINQKKTTEFANADNQKLYAGVNFSKPRKNEKIVYEFKNMLLPIYATFTYNISIFTQYQQQMNELLQPFLAKTGSLRYFIIEKDGYKYECYIESNIETKNNISGMEEEERRYISNITIKVLGNLISSGLNENDTIIKTFENAVELKLPKEKIIVETIKTEPKELQKNAAIQAYSNVAVKKVYNIGNGVDISYIVNHDLNTRDLYASVRENFGTYSLVTVSIDYSNLNYITINMDEVIEPNSYTVIIIG